MKREYDFVNAARGKFHRPEMELVPPVHLDPGVLTWLTSRAQAKGTTLNALVNEMLKKDIERIEAAK
jgi:predicted HicB family RNase H-like nuclease